MKERLIRGIWQRLYRLYGVRSNVCCGSNLHVGLGTILWAPNRLSVGENVYIGKFCTIECDGSIGNNAMIANNVGLIGRYDHDYKYIGKPIRKAPWIGDPLYAGAGKDMQIIVDDDVWIGFGTVVLSGVKIGRGAIVGAGAVVTKDVESYSIVAGNPARKIGIRFTDDEVIEHEKVWRYAKDS
jgi:acetyltransferase-like isoleucine patch superfamily enzyme